MTLQHADLGIAFAAASDEKDWPFTIMHVGPMKDSFYPHAHCRHFAYFPTIGEVNGHSIYECEIPSFENVI